MQKIVLIATVCIICSIGCNNNPASTEKLDNETDTPQADNAYFDCLEKLGINKKNMKETENCIIVEDDIVFLKKDIPVERSIAKQTQRYWNPLISLSNRGNVDIYIHPSMQSWKSVVYDAIMAWNRINDSQIYMRLVNSGADMVIYADTATALLYPNFKNLPDNIGGRSVYPNGNVGPMISINMDAPAVITHAQRVYVLIHEIGHTLGLMHTDQNSGNYIVSTPWTDDQSLMNSVAYNSTMALSKYDKYALVCLYPSNRCITRYYSALYTDHVYSKGTYELGMGNSVWGFEGVEFRVEEYQKNGTIPLYRFYNSAYTDHFYSTNYQEGINAGYVYEGIIGYVYGSTAYGRVPLYRYWRPSDNSHFFTTNFNELGRGNSEWIYEGAACYVYCKPHV